MARIEISQLESGWCITIDGVTKTYPASEVSYHDTRDTVRAWSYLWTIQLVPKESGKSPKTESVVADTAELALGIVKKSPWMRHDKYEITGMERVGSVNFMLRKP